MSEVCETCECPNTSTTVIYSKQAQTQHHRCRAKDKKKRYIERKRGSRERTSQTNRVSILNVKAIQQKKKLICSRLTHSFGFGDTDRDGH